MKVLKIILSIVVAVVVLFFVVALFLPSSYSVERSIVINKPPEVVFEQVVKFDNYLKWNPWTEMEPTAKNTITGSDGEIGATWAWEGEKVGTGSLTITNIEENKSIESKLAFTAPQESEATDYWFFQPTENGTKVTWRNEGELPYGFARYVGLFMDGSILGPAFEKGLANLKETAEALPEPEPEMETDMAEEMDGKES